MPISDEFLKKFKEGHGLSRDGELHCWIKTARMRESLASVVCLNIAAPEAAECGLGRELARRLAQERGCYITDRIDYSGQRSKPVFAIDCEEDSELEPAFDKLRGLKIEYIRMIDRIYGAFKPKSI